ncbi:MAG: hypothetical protein OXQ29_28290, partial [Rhodospirillaceae bacterium]|nr:hypothetical protein [Rhodospirillaceae bacterium]
MYSAHPHPPADSGLVQLAGETAVHVRTRNGQILAPSADGSSFLAQTTAGLRPVGPYVAEYEAANGLLAAGAPLAKLCEAAGATESGYAFAYLLWLQRLHERGLLEYPVVDAAGERAVIQPQWSSFAVALAPAAPPPEAVLDRFACLRRDGNGWMLESPLVGARVRFVGLAALETDVVRRALDAAGFLDDAPCGADPRSDALAQWEFHDLLFHAHRRIGWHRDPMGPALPFVGRIAPPPAARPTWPGERIYLPRAPAAGGESFPAVLERRRSERDGDAERPLTLDDLGALLDRVARIRSSRTAQVGNDPSRTTAFELTRRPYP